MKSISLPSNFKIILSFAAIYIIWGTTYLAIKVGISELPPFLMAAFRYLLAAVLLFSFCLVRKLEPLKTAVIKNILLGALMLSVGQGILFWAELHISSGLTAVLVATLPLCYVLADRKNRKSYFHSKLTFISMALGLAGIVLLFKNQLSGGEANDGMVLIASLVVLASCFCWALGSIYYKNHLAPENLFQDVSWQLLGGAVACILISIAADPIQTFHFYQVSIKAWGAVAYLAIAGSIIAFTASYYLLSVRPPAVVGTYAYVNPIIAVLLGVLVANEKISALQVCSIALILLAAYLSNRVKLKQ